jgi:hypothetical protein
MDNDFGFKSSGGISPADLARITTLENNEYKVTYYEIISGTSGSLTVPSQATINAGEFGLSGNAILSKIDGSNKPTFQSPTTSAGVIVTASLNVGTGAWVASGTYTDPFVALIYSIKIKAVYYSNLTYNNIIETVSNASVPLNSLNNIFASCTVIGWSSYTTSAVDVIDLGNVYMININISGTSNAATTTVQLPYTNNGNALLTDMTLATNTGTNITGRWVIGSGSDTITFNTTAGAGAYSNSGTKTVYASLMLPK